MPGNQQQFSIRWNSHLVSLGAAFPQMLAGQRFVDVTLACEGHQVHCHRLVLAACSSYFESLLEENPSEHPIIILPRDIKLWEIQALVDFMYRGEVNVSQDGLKDLVKCAEMLQIRGLHGAYGSLNLNNNPPPPPSRAETSRPKTPKAKNINITEEPMSEHHAENQSEDPGESTQHPEHNNLQDRDELMIDDTVKIKTEIVDDANEASTYNCGSIRVVPNENLFDNYSGANMTDPEDLLDIAKIEIEEQPDRLLPPSLKFNRKSMSISVRSSRSSSVEALENVVCSPDAANGEDEDSLIPPLIPFTTKSDMMDEFSSPPKAFVLRNPRGNQPRSYDIEALWAALMHVKAGESIYRASQIHKVPRKTLRNWMKRWDIKSSFPMPRQLRQAAEKKRMRKQDHV
ncbi:broad-complex core protein isoforms 1/2/3/4/5 [Sergentomyia squamirostris]